MSELNLAGACIFRPVGRQRAGRLHAVALPYQTGDLLDVERRVLECLGRGPSQRVEWLPTEVQRQLFEHAASGAPGDAARLKSQIARFLHGHKDASESR